MDKQKEIIEMFNTISPTYDKLNRILSLGIDRAWRRNGCKKVLSIYEKPIEKLVDVATGTGDLLLFWQEAAKKAGREIADQVGVDPASGMLEIAKKKVVNAQFLLGEATALPIESDQADIVSISYGIRNVVELDKALAEFFRVLKPSGMLMVLEFMSHEKKSIMDKMMLFYMKTILPTIGKLISKDKRAYTYLPESIEAFLSADQMKAKLISAGFEIVEIYDEPFKISTRFIAQKPA